MSDETSRDNDEKWIQLWDPALDRGQDKQPIKKKAFNMVLSEFPYCLNDPEQTTFNKFFDMWGPKTVGFQPDLTMRRGQYGTYYSDSDRSPDIRMHFQIESVVDPEQFVTYASTYLKRSEDEPVWGICKAYTENAKLHKTREEFECLAKTNSAIMALWLMCSHAVLEPYDNMWRYDVDVLIKGDTPLQSLMCAL